MYPSCYEDITLTKKKRVACLAICRCGFQEATVRSALANKHKGRWQKRNRFFDTDHGVLISNIFNLIFIKKCILVTAWPLGPIAAIRRETGKSFILPRPPADEKKYKNNKKVRSDGTPQQWCNTVLFTSIICTLHSPKF